MTARFMVAAMGQDRPGIVAAVSDALFTLGGNVEDVSTSILRGHFALMLVVATPDTVDLRRVEGALDQLGSVGITVTAWEIHGPLNNTEATHVLTVYGPDRPGIVRGVARALAEQSVNISDATCRIHPGDPAIYIVTVEVTLPAGTNPESVSQSIAAVVGPMGLETTLRSIERAEI